MLQFEGMLWFVLLRVPPGECQHCGMLWELAGYQCCRCVQSCCWILVVVLKFQELECKGQQRMRDSGCGVVVGFSGWKAWLSNTCHDLVSVVPARLGVLGGCWVACSGVPVQECRVRNAWFMTVY